MFALSTGRETGSSPVSLLTMDTYARAHHLSWLVEALGVIAPGAVFERFCARFLGHYLAVR
jgi:hypothetical protein